MGMLFNTAGTQRILGMLTHAFTGTAFTELVTTTLPTIVATLQTLGKPGAIGAQGTFKTIAEPLNIVDADPKVHKNWKKWLNLLDTTPQPGGAGGFNIAYYIAQPMAAAIADQNCIGIEFYAIPGPTLKAMSTSQYPMPTAANPQYTLIVSIETQTVDKY